MKKTIAELINPANDYFRSVGELARTVQFLLTHANDFRDKGRWGSSGPHEILTNHSGCTNCFNETWHSQRMVAGGQDKCPVPSWKQHHDCLIDCVIESLCEHSPALLAWRKQHHIHLETMLKFPMAYQNNDAEREAWKALTALHGYKMQHVSTLNSFHRRVNVLCEPQLKISKDAITLSCNVTDRRELRESPLCFSGWSVCSLLSSHPNYVRPPRWNPRRETFAAFILRGVDWYKNIQQPKKALP